jgi:hypothetical protein
MMASQAGNPVVDDRLLKAMAEELKLPLLQIARQAELSTGPDDAARLRAIELSAMQALWFVDGYLLSQQLQQTSLQLEPVAVSAVLHETAQLLEGLARQHNCSLELHLDGRFAPVMAHRQGLQTALLALGSTLITMAQPDDDQPTHLILAAHRSHSGIVAGIFSQTEGLSQSVYQRGRALYGRARQPMQEFTAQAGAGVFVADSLFNSMDSRLRVAKHRQLTGLAATLQPSRQLSLI